MKKIFVLVATLMLFAAPAAAGAESNDDDRLKVRAGLDGSQEATPVDTDMTGEVRIKIKDGELEFRLRVRDNSGTILAAHIHCAGPGANGSVGVNLGVETFTDDKGTIARGEIDELNENGCGWTSIDDVKDAIEANAAYVNVHTAANPSGEIRGDLG